MQFAVPQLTTVVLLAHMVLGCCWHHGHACEAGGSLARQGEGGRGHADATHANGQEGCSPSEQSPDGHDDSCDGDRCTFLRTKSPSEDDTSAAGSHAWDLTAAVPCGPAEHDLEKSSHRADSFPGKPLLPTKAYLLFRVLLI